MLLRIETNDGTWDSETEIDLDDVFNQDHVLDEGDFAEALVIELASAAIQHGVALTDITPDYVEDDNGAELGVYDDDDFKWVYKVAQLAWYVLGEKPSYEEPEPLFAKIEGEGWRWFDFEGISSWDDEYVGEFDGDYEEYAKNNMEDSLPEHLERHFDYSSYGEELIEAYNSYEWDGSTYLFHQ